MRIGKRIGTLASALLLFLGTAVGTASLASAQPSDKPQVLANWTQTSAASYNSWLAAYNNKGAWSSYNFDWSTDLCSWSPDNPLGFPFERSCARHDFGYRNYKAQGNFPANKARLDNAFHEDLKRVCNGYSGVTHGTCVSLAWTYYQAVRNFG